MVKKSLFVSGAFSSLSKEYYFKIDKSTSNKLYKLNANQDSIEKYIYKWISWRHNSNC